MARPSEQARPLPAETSGVDAAMARFAAPEGWRVLRTRSRLEAHWASPDGRWARYSIRLEPREGAAAGEPPRTRAAGEPPGEVFFQRDVGAAQLTVTFTSSDLSAETIEAASALLTPVQHLLARAGA